MINPFEKEAQLVAALPCSLKTESNLKRNLRFSSFPSIENAGRIHKTGRVVRLYE